MGQLEVRRIFKTSMSKVAYTQVQGTWSLQDSTLHRLSGLNFHVRAKRTDRHIQGTGHQDDDGEYHCEMERAVFT